MKISYIHQRGDLTLCGLWVGPNFYEIWLNDEFKVWEITDSEGNSVNLPAREKKGIIGFLREELESTLAPKP